MALFFTPTLSTASSTKMQHRGFFFPKLSTNIITSSLSMANKSDHTILRRSANYKPTIWNDDYIQSLTGLSGNLNKSRIEELKSEVRMMLDQGENSVEKLELIETLQRLGLAYQFEESIQEILESVYEDKYATHTKEVENAEELHATALEFKLLREYGYQVSQDIFDIFKDNKGNFKTCLCNDIKGLLSLYEASFLLVEGESILEDAKLFATKYLKKFIKESAGHEYLSTLAIHALELPQRWRMLRLEARWFIDVYERYEYMIPLLLELAKLDFNHVQAIHQEDLKHMSRWWSNTGLGQELSFARDRLMENFFWTVGVAFQPKLSYFRRILTKVNALITTIDDIYDVFGTLEELEKFTTAVERWDIDAVEQLPDYMKLCFLTLHNSTNEIGFDILKERGFHVIPYLKKAWLDLCKSYLLEAQWYYNGYTPTLQEYLDNAWISISAPLILVHAYSSVSTQITRDNMEIVKDYPRIIECSSMILRLADDLGTSSDELKRGDIPKSIQCYMVEAGVSELEAREYIHYLIYQTWTKMNKDHLTTRSMFPKTFVDIAMNLARMAQCMYQNGDGHASQHAEIKHHILSLLVKPTTIK